MSGTPEPSSLCRPDCPPRAWPQSSDIQAGTVRALSLALVTQAEAAHVCYIAAGVLPQPWTPSAQFCLPGTDHRAHPRTFASVAALQASDILEWLLVQGGPAGLSASFGVGGVSRPRRWTAFCRPWQLVHCTMDSRRRGDGHRCMQMLSLTMYRLPPQSDLSRLYLTATCSKAGP